MYTQDITDKAKLKAAIEKTKPVLVVIDTLTLLRAPARRKITLKPARSYKPCENIPGNTKYPSSSFTTSRSRTTKTFLRPRPISKRILRFNGSIRLVERERL